MNQLNRRRWLFVALGTTGSVMIRGSVACGAAVRKPSSVEVRQIAQEYFREVSDYRAGDLIMQEDAAAVLALLARRGWTVPNAKALLADCLTRGDVLARSFSSLEGRRFMRKVAGYQLIYDRLDRIARVPGGPQLLQGLVKLPDGERYARWETARGVPDLLDLLPKERSGRRRSIEAYRKPTGRIYTQAELLRRIDLAYSEPARPASPVARS